MSVESHKLCTQVADEIAGVSSRAAGKRIAEQLYDKAFNDGIEAAAKLFEDLVDRFPGQHRQRVLALKRTP